MRKEIAVYMNNLGEITDIKEAGIIKVFSKNNEEWNVRKELSFKFNSTKEKEDIRLDTLNIAEALENCKIFIAKEFSDLAYLMLDSMGFSTWKMDGAISEILEYVLEKEEEEAEEIKLINSSRQNDKKQSIEPTEIGENGCYIFNLKELQEHNTGVTSKQALKPFLNNKGFSELIITCSHIPNWVEDELEKLNLSYEFSRTGQNDYILIISKANQKSQD
ncbi:Fe-only nitrogenase accessory protein AnfO [Clostridium sp.]|uniref:Fe-only nitrogenase accessory protein AnfO n=1 Tax=Clostridium sp. TaxID=1506 RepID=UPI00262B7881|nr:Fe-only nitrogenase accessory protein AnfO [Clostridium sp.]